MATYPIHYPTLATIINTLSTVCGSKFFSSFLLPGICVHLIKQASIPHNILNTSLNLNILLINCHCHFMHSLLIVQGGDLKFRLLRNFNNVIKNIKEGMVGLVLLIPL